MFNHDVTIFNKWYDKETRTDKYIRTIFNNIHVEVQSSQQTKDKGVSADGNMFANIPFTVIGYINPKDYQELLESDLKGRWTLQTGDIIVKGIIENDIDSPKYLNHLDNCFTIKSVETIDYSVTCLNHFEVIAI